MLGDVEMHDPPAWWRRTTKTNRIRPVTVGTVKKSIELSAATAWARLVSSVAIVSVVGVTSKTRRRDQFSAPSRPQWVQNIQ